MNNTTIIKNNTQDNSKNYSLENNFLESDYQGIIEGNDLESYDNLEPLKVVISQLQNCENNKNGPNCLLKLCDKNGNLAKTVTDIKVSFIYTATEVNGDDYTGKSMSVIAAGTSTNIIDIKEEVNFIGADYIDYIDITITEVKSNGVVDITIDDINSYLNLNIDNALQTFLSIEEIKVNEETGFAEFTVCLTGESISSEVTVDYFIGDITVYEEDEARLPTGTLTFNPGITSHTVTVSIMDEVHFGYLGIFNVVLVNAINARVKDEISLVTHSENCINDMNSAWVSVIENNDSKYESEYYKDTFSTSSLPNNEQATFTVEIRDSNGKLKTSKINVTVDILYSGTASNGTEFVGIASVIIPANSSSFDFNIAALDDFISDRSENVTIKLINVIGGSFNNIAIDVDNSTLVIRILEKC